MAIASLPLSNNVYLTEMTKLVLNTVVTKVSSDAKGIFVCLQDTIFCPQGGGQKADVGFINNVRVINAFKEGSHTEFCVKHYIEEEDHPFSEGMEVALKVDETVRTRNARLHTAGHLIGSIVENKYSNMEVSRTQHFPEDAYMSFKITDSSQIDTNAIIEYVKKTLPEVVDQGGTVSISFNDSMRNIMVEGYDPVPCGGTHLTKIQDIGDVNILGIKKKKSNVTIRYSIVE